MRAILLTVLSGLTLAFGTCLSAVAAGPPPTDFQPDPKSVQRYGPAYRYPQAGWVVLHIEGEPYDRGYQHGRLMADDIVAHLRCMAAVQNSKAPDEGWKQVRTLVNAMFVRRYEQEFLEEMKGIAEGASAAGGKIFDRPVDLVDIVALNSWPEVETLPSALEATATGLEAKIFPKPELRAMPTPKPMHCSAFAATGPATADGKIVFGHITMFSLYASSYYNVWLDVKPAKGHRVFMQSYPGGIQSGMDYYYNDAGLLVCETTLAQTKFDIKGMTVASRIRQALQYADSIDKAVEILAKDNNGLYTNEWLLGDIKTNEIAMYELGTAKSKLYRSSKNEWFGGTEGFYWGCNNTKDVDVRLETIASLEGKPGNPVFCPSPREKEWVRLYNKHKGKIGVDFGKEAFTTPIIAAAHSLDAKFTTTDLAKDLKTWALFGPPLRRSWQPTQDERQRYPEIQPLVSNPWTVLHAQPPAKEAGDKIAAVDLVAPTQREKEEAKHKHEDEGIESGPAWHGTLLPKTNADIWLATAFADYERYYSLEKRLRRKSGGKLTDEDRDRLAVERYGYLSSYRAAARALGGDVPLSKTKPEVGDDKWYRIAAGKGFWAMHELRHEITDGWIGTGIEHDRVDICMGVFGKLHGGKKVSTKQLDEWLYEELQIEKEYMGYGYEPPGSDKWTRMSEWDEKIGFRKMVLRGVEASFEEGKYTTRFIVDDVSGHHVWQSIEVTVQTKAGEETVRCQCGNPGFNQSVETTSRPIRIIVDKYGEQVKTNGGVYSIGSFHSELDKTLIVYGTDEEAAANREAAEDLQKLIVTRWSNFTVPIKPDKEVTSEDLKNRHLLLIGRPDCNPLVEKFRGKLPIQFGPRSFNVRSEWYANSGSAVIAAAENPQNNRYSVVVIAGLSARATIHAIPRLFDKGSAEVVVLPQGRESKALVMPAPELNIEIKEIAGENANKK